MPRSCASAARRSCTGSASRRSATATRPRNSGRAAERRAAWWYRLRGWRVVGTNVWAGGNELDVIVRRGRELRFVEVKEKRGQGFGDPLEMVTAEKQRRVRRAAAAWLAGRPDLAGLRLGFDVVAVREGHLRRVEDAF